jgi:hypothetical protein
LAHFGGIDGGDVVAYDHDREPVAHRTPYTNHGKRLAQRLADKRLDRLALCRGGLCRLLVQLIIL